MLAAAFVFVTVRTEKDILLVNQMSLKHMRGTWSTLVLPPRPWGSSVCSAEYRVQFLVEMRSIHAHRQSGIETPSVSPVPPLPCSFPEPRYFVLEAFSVP